MALQPFAHKGSPVIKSIDHNPNLLSAIGNGSSKPGGAYMLSFAFNKPNTTCKPSNMILAFGATKHEQKTKHASFCTQNERNNLALWTLSNNTYRYEDGTTSLDCSFEPLYISSNPCFDHNMKLRMISTCSIC